MEAIQEFFSMGGRGVYVWSAYAVFAGVIVFNVLAPLLRRRQALRLVARQQRRREALAERTGAASGRVPD